MFHFALRAWSKAYGRHLAKLARQFSFGNNFEVRHSRDAADELQTCAIRSLSAKVNEVVGVFMYCPTCSQQQISEEMRFCSRCGFPLEGVKELIATGGVIEKQDINSLAERHNGFFCGVRKSLALMLAVIPMLIIVGILSAINNNLATLALLPLCSFLIGFVLLIYTTAKEMKRRKKETAVALAQQHTSSRNAQLPPQRAIPVDNFTQRIKTAEMAYPASVTENTTRLLDEEPAPQR